MAAAGGPSRTAAPRGPLERPLLRRVLSPWSLVGASVVVSAEAALFLGTAAVPFAVGASVLAVAAACGVVGVLRLVADRRAAARLDAAQAQAPAGAQALRLPETRPAARAVVPAARAAVPAAQAHGTALPRQRRSCEDTSTGPFSLV